MIKILLDVVFVFGLLACLAMLLVSAAIIGTAVLSLIGGLLKAAHLRPVHRRAPGSTSADREVLRNFGIQR